jgi:hypothetical protein
MSGAASCFAIHHPGIDRRMACQDNYVLLTFNRQEKTLTIDLKSLESELLDRTEVKRK